MCNFCEPYRHVVQDPITEEVIEEWISVDPLYNSASYIAEILGETPISRRRGKETGLTSSILVARLKDSDFNIPIRFCPICGKDLYSGKTKN